MKLMENSAAWSMVIIGTLVLCGCGGGGGGGSTPRQQGTFSLSTSSLTFDTGSVGTTPSSQSVSGTVTGVDASTLFIRIEIAGNAVQSVGNLNVSPGSTTGSMQVIPRPASDIGPGTYSSTITVYACTSNTTCSTGQLSGSPQTVNVTYTVRGIQASAASLDYSIGNAPSAAARTRSLTISGYPSQSWTASTATPWLQLSATSGNTSNASGLDVTIDTAQLQGLRNGTYPSSITLTPQSGAQVTIPVVMTLLRTQIDTVAPYVAISNESKEVIIRGALFDASSITGVNFGAVAASSYQVVSSTEIRATHPQLAAAEYPVLLAGPAATSAFSRANLVVIDPRNYQARSVSPAASSMQSEPFAIVHDAPRQTVHVGIRRSPGFANDLFTYSHAGSDNWNSSFSNFFSTSGLHAIALSADGKALIVSKEQEFSYHSLDPSVTGSAINMQILPLFANAANYVRSLAVANDGRVLGVTAADGGGYRPVFSMPSLAPEQVTPAPTIFNQLTPAGSTDPNILFDGTAGASLDGARVLLTSSVSGPVYSYDAADGQLSNTGQTLSARSIEMDRTGSRVLIDNSNVYDGNLQPLGTLPAGTVSAALSPDGSRVYTYDSTNHVNRFDVSSLGTVAASWAPASGQTLDSTRRIVMTVSRDGRTLFIAGYDKLLVEPAQ